MIAVNVFDLGRDLILARFLIAPVIERREIIDAEPGRIDGKAIVLHCDDQRAEAIVDIVRIKYAKHILRFYHGEGKTWKRV